MTDRALTIDNPGDAAIMEQVIATGDLSKLAPEQRVRYYMATCRSLGLNPFTKPFEYIVLNGRMVLYARKDATDQLRKVHRVNTAITSTTTENDIYCVTVRATTPDGREDWDLGAVNIKGLSGDALANAYMKAITKGKRRATLSLLGLGMLDETEVETIPGARRVTVEEAETTPSKAHEIIEQDELSRLRDEFSKAVRIKGFDAQAVREKFAAKYGKQPEDATIDQLNDAIALLSH